MGKFIDLSGKIFGNWKVLYREKDNLNGKKPVTIWRCECLLCNKEYNVRANSLINGTSKCCVVCSRTNREYHKIKDNNFYNNGEYIIGQLKCGENFIFDIDDYEKVSCIYWRKTENGYIYGMKNNEFILLHRLVLKNKLDVYNTKMDVDHINHNKLDNRKCNLRIVTRSQNNMNRTPTNVYGVNGVSYYSNLNKYVARITIDNNVIPLGNFENIEDAINARRSAENMYYKEYSYENSMKTQQED